MKKTNLIAGALLCGASLFMASCQPKQAAPQLTKSGLDPENFVLEVGGKQTALYTLTNANGLEVCITNYGGRVVSLVVPDRDGNLLMLFSVLTTLPSMPTLSTLLPTTVHLSVVTLTVSLEASSPLTVKNTSSSRTMVRTACMAAEQQVG